MTVLAEPTRVREWFKTQLGDDATLQSLLGGAGRVYAEVADPDAEFPCVLIVTLSPGLDLTAIGGYRVMTSPRYQVKVVTRGEGGRASAKSIQTAADRIENLLYMAQGVTASGLRVMSVSRVRPWSRSYIEDGTRYEELGGEWDMDVQAA